MEGYQVVTAWVFEAASEFDRKLAAEKNRRTKVTETRESDRGASSRSVLAREVAARNLLRSFFFALAASTELFACEFDANAHASRRSSQLNVPEVLSLVEQSLSDPLLTASDAICSCTIPPRPRLRLLQHLNDVVTMRSLRDVSFSSNLFAFNSKHETYQHFEQHFACAACLRIAQES